MHVLPVSICLFLLISFIAFSATITNPADLISWASIDCGSISASASINGKEWIGDVKPTISTLLRIKGSSTTSTVPHRFSSAEPVPYMTARISRYQFSYAFQVDPGQIILRLHFNAVAYKGFKGLKDLFTVEAGSFVLLGNFSASLTADALGVNTFVKEFCISIEENQELSLSFLPVNSQTKDRTYAFINGIEIISVPVHLSYFRGGELRAQVIGQNSPVYIDNTTALELIHRLNFRRNSVPPGDDSDDILGMWTTIQKRKNNELDNLTWDKSVDVGFRYLIRIYFSKLELKRAETGGLIFKVLIDEMVVDTNMEIVNEKDSHGVPCYRDYMVAIKGQKQEGKRGLFISLQSNNELIDGHRLLEGFEIYKLSNPDNSLASPNALPPARDSPSWIIKNVLSVLGCKNVTATVAIAIIALIDIIVYNSGKIREVSIPEDENKPSARAERLCKRFSLAEMQSATKNFSEAFVIGKGGFGKVYKGLIGNGQETVAIKRLKSNSKQGKQEFLTEIETLSQLRHINLVSLIGYCSERREMILVYEYMACGTLADHLYKIQRDGNNFSPLTWNQCLNICIGAGRGLDYLHTGSRIIHRDVKPSNILLDENFVAKVSDFGLAKPEDRSKLKSHISTKVKGTFGYFDPYYFSTHKLTRKSDTYAFGVVLLEVLCGRPAMDPTLGEDACYLTKWAQNKINKGEIEQIIGPSLIKEISPDSLKVFVGVAERCLHDNPKERPTMAQVVLQLESALEQHESRKLIVPNEITNAVADTCSPNHKNIASASTVQERADNLAVQIATPPSADQTNRKVDNTGHPSGKKDGKKRKIYKTLWPWADAFRNRLKLFKKKGLLQKPDSEFFGEEVNLPKLDFAKIAAATNKFSSSNTVGQGGFGSVYKGVFPKGQKVAIKIYTRRGLNEFKRQILLVSRLHHENIIKLLGYCIHDGGILVYEFMENGSLATFIFNEVRREQLQWSVRFKIIMGVTKGIIYLHHELRLKLIHGDIKPSNILLDTEMNPKLSGFGTAKTSGDDEFEAETTIAGTLGYIAPEFATYGRPSDKVDVYSFGIVVMEILSGKGHMGYPRYDGNLIGHAWMLWNEGKALDLVDESLGGAYSVDEAMRCIQVALLCIQSNPDHRPTMFSVLKMLLGEELSLSDKVAEAASHPNNRDWYNRFSSSDSVATFEYDNTMQR